MASTELAAALSELEKYLMNYTHKDLLARKEVMKVWRNIKKLADQTKKNAEDVKRLLAELESRILQHCNVKLQNKGNYLTLTRSIVRIVESEMPKTKDMKARSTDIATQKESRQHEQSPTQMSEADTDRQFQGLCRDIDWLYCTIKDLAAGQRLDTHKDLVPSENNLRQEAQKELVKILNVFKSLDKRKSSPHSPEAPTTTGPTQTETTTPQKRNDTETRESDKQMIPSPDSEQENRAMEQLKYLEGQNEKLHKTVQTLRQDLQNISEEKDRLMIRMSKMAGDKLTHNNPGITDLSDPNRPQKIGEKYGELYDNEWADAMDILNPKREDKHDRGCIRVLEQILKFCYSECEKIADDQLSQLEMDCFSLQTRNKRQAIPVEGTEGTKRFLLDAVHSSSLFAMGDAVDIVKLSLMREKTLKNQVKQIWPYTEKCIEICWSMVTHHPRLILLWPDVSEEIRPDIFQAYTRSGNTLEYVVWPAMQLYKDGPLLRKGTVQPVSR